MNRWFKIRYRESRNGTAVVWFEKRLDKWQEKKGDVWGGEIKTHLMRTYGLSQMS